MCKLFVAYRCENMKKLLYTNLHHKHNHTNFENGYGISWFQKKHWKTYKCNCVYLTDTKSCDVIDNINSKIVISHIRNISNRLANAELTKQMVDENVQPIMYAESQLIHHGGLFCKINNKMLSYQLGHTSNEFITAVSNIMQHIDKKLQKKIQGITDSEILFYLLLSVIGDKNMDNAGALVNGFKHMNKIIENASIANSSNICFTNDHYIAVANIYKNYSGQVVQPVHLYIDNTDGVVFCNTKLTATSRLVNENTLYLINIKTSDVTQYKI